MTTDTTTVRMFVDGQAMRGGSLNDGLQGPGATFLGAVETAAKYRFYSVRDEFPGIFPAMEEAGRAVPGELYSVTYEVLREIILPREPPELELGVIELADGTGTLTMRMRDAALSAPGVTDISDEGGWLAHLNTVGGMR